MNYRLRLLESRRSLGCIAFPGRAWERVYSAILDSKSFTALPDTVRAPDVAFVRRDRLPDGPQQGFIQGAPDLTVEVLSPSDSASEVNAKAEAWLSAGANAVWLVDPARETGMVACLRDGVYSTCAVETLECEEVLPGFQLSRAAPSFSTCHLVSM